MNEIRERRIQFVREWAAKNITEVSACPNPLFSRLLFLSIIDAFAQGSTEYKNKSNLDCFCQFVVKYSSEKSNLEKICPVTLYYDYSGKGYDLPRISFTEGMLIGYDEKFANEEAERILLSLPEEIRNEARKRHQYIKLLYRLRSKLVHELNAIGTPIEFEKDTPMISSGSLIDVDENGKIVTTKHWTLNFPKDYLEKLKGECVFNYIDECYEQDKDPLPVNQELRKCTYSWYDD